MNQLSILLFIFGITLSTCFTCSTFQYPPNYGSIAPLSVLAGAAVSNAGETFIYGDVGTNAITGFPPGVINGSIVNSTVDLNAQLNLGVIVTNASACPCSLTLSGQNLGGMTLFPGVYCFSSSASLTGTLTLDAGNDSSPFWIFNIQSTLITSTGASLNLINGASSCQVFWLIGSSGTFGTGTAFGGTVIAYASITFVKGSTLVGKLLAVTASVTLDTNQIYPCQSNVIPVSLEYLKSTAHSNYTYFFVLNLIIFIILAFQ